MRICKKKGQPSKLYYLTTMISSFIHDAAMLCFCKAHMWRSPGTRRVKARWNEQKRCIYGHACAQNTTFCQCLKDKNTTPIRRKFYSCRCGCMIILQRCCRTRCVRVISQRMLQDVRLTLSVTRGPVRVLKSMALPKNGR